MKKKENADMIVKNRRVNASERANGVPKRKFIAKMKMPRKRPPLMDRSHLLPDLANMMSGICRRKMTINAKAFVNMRDVVKSPIVRMNFARGSILWIGLSNRVNLNPSTNLRDNLPSPVRRCYCFDFSELWNEELPCRVSIDYFIGFSHHWKPLH